MKLKVNGVTLSYELHGKGKPLVLISGFTSDRTFWRTVLEHLSAQFQILVFDNRGAGQSDSPDEPYLIEDMAKDVVGLIYALGLEKPHLLGHSMGGAIAQTIAYHHSDLIDKLILSNSLIKVNMFARFMKQTIMNLRKEKSDHKEIVKAKMPWIFSKNFLQDEKRVEELIQFELTQQHPQSFIGFKRQLEALFTFDSSSWHHKIPHKTLVIGSDEDILCAGDTEALGNNIPSAQFVKLSESGHAPSMEKPHEFNEAIFNFLG